MHKRYNINCYIAYISIKTKHSSGCFVLNLNISADRMVLYRRYVIQVSDLSTFYISI